MLEDPTTRKRCCGADGAVTARRHGTQLGSTGPQQGASAPHAVAGRVRRCDVLLGAARSLCLQCRRTCRRLDEMALPPSLSTCERTGETAADQVQNVLVCMGRRTQHG